MNPIDLAIYLNIVAILILGATLIELKRRG